MRRARLRNGVFSSAADTPGRQANVTGNGNGNTPTPARARSRSGWTADAAEAALSDLKGVVSARIVQRSDGAIQEIHVLTADDVPPKRTVRRVESALLTKFGLKVDHRKVSVAQSRWPIGDRGKKAKSSASFLREPTFPGVDRPHMRSAVRGRELRFDGHEVELEPSGRMRVRVFLEAEGRRFSGEAIGSQRARSRMTMLASATVDAVRASLHPNEPRPHSELSDTSLVLEDVDVVDAFTKDFVLASVSAKVDGGVTSVAGVAAVEGSLDRAVILSTLQAAHEWVRENA